MENKDKIMQPAMSVPSAIHSDDAPGKNGRSSIIICPECNNRIAKTGPCCPVCGKKIWNE